VRVRERVSVNSRVVTGTVDGADDDASEAGVGGEADPESAAERAVEAERRRLFTLITRMVNWDNIGDEHLMRDVREEIRRSIEILSRRTKNNPVLIGEPGVGKTAIVEGLARRQRYLAVA